MTITTLATLNDAGALALPPEIADLVAAWHAHLARSVELGDMASTSATTYRASVRKFCEWLASAGAMATGPDAVRDFKLAMLAKASPASVNVWLSGVRAFYAWGMENGRMASNPAASVKGARRRGANKSHKRDALSDAEVVRLLTLQLPARDHAILALKAFTGVRDVEVHRADLADLRTRDGRRTLQVRGKGHTDKDDFVVLNTQMEVALSAWLAERGADPGPLFTSGSRRNLGGRLSLQAIRAMVKDAYRAVGIVESTKTSHSLRHTAITKVLRATRDPLRAKGMSRHASLDTLMIYAHELGRIESPAEDAIDYGAGK